MLQYIIRTSSQSNLRLERMKTCRLHAVCNNLQTVVGVLLLFRRIFICRRICVRLPCGNEMPIADDVVDRFPLSLGSLMPIDSSGYWHADVCFAV